jgi:hypothetical protein
MDPRQLPIDRRRPEPGSEGPRPDIAAQGRIDRLAMPRLRADAALLPTPLRSYAAVLQFWVVNDGLAEYPAGSNNNWITKRCGLGAVPWCAETVSLALLYGGFGSLDDMVMDGVGVPTTYDWGWAYVPYIRAVFDAAGKFSWTPTAGSLVVLFDEAHVGWLEEDLGDGTILTREGNASDRLGQFRRSLEDVVGFCLIPYQEDDDDMFTDDDRAALQLVRDYVQYDRKGSPGRDKPSLDDNERFVAEVATELVGAVEQAGDNNRGLGWRRLVATLKGVRRPKA